MIIVSLSDRYYPFLIEYDRFFLDMKQRFSQGVENLILMQWMAFLNVVGVLHSNFFSTPITNEQFNRN